MKGFSVRLRYSRIDRGRSGTLAFHGAFLPEACRQTDRQMVPQSGQARGRCRVGRNRTYVSRRPLAYPGTTTKPSGGTARRLGRRMQGGSLALGLPTSTAKGRTLDQRSRSPPPQPSPDPRGRRLSSKEGACSVQNWNGSTGVRPDPPRILLLPNAPSNIISAPQQKDSP